MAFLQAIVLSVLFAVAICLSIPQQATANIEARAAEAHWSALGCYIDNVHGRALSTQLLAGTSMTNEICQSACLAAGYPIAGNEYGSECWCGNSFQNGGSPASDGNRSCNVPCNGNAAEICGSGNHLTAFQYTSDTVARASPAKRGLVYNDNNPDGNAEWANYFKSYKSTISWGYNWGYTSSLGLDSAFEFVPMMWAPPSSTNLTIPNELINAVQTTGVKNLLALNEPDLTYSQSANMLPEAAAAAFVAFIEPFREQVRIGLPNVLWNNVGSSSGGDYDTAQWMQYFIGNCTNCHFDFAPIHYYQDCDPTDGQDGAAWFEGNVTNVHDVLGLPVWITEFQCQNGNDSQQIGFLQKVLPWLDAQSFVERYSYFGVFEDFLINADGSGLSDIGLAYATI